MRFNDQNYERLIMHTQTANGMPEVLPRTTRCGSREADLLGLVPMFDYPDDLVHPADFKGVIHHCHERKIFPVYHQKASGVLDDGWDQDGFGFCWAYGVTIALMDQRALENQAPVRLSPFSLGWLTGWRNAGFYCDRAIAGARERGIASAEFVPEWNLRPSTFKPGWEQDALNYRCGKWWDTYKQNEIMMLQQCLTILRTGTALYVAYNWWSHALELVAMLWDETERNNVVIVLRNSHAEPDVIELAGSRAVPDEAYGLQRSSLPH